tara:strand:- start:640 stop:1608 length:969 start_codon:yes stop_codon:yes gene_type:complete
MAKGINKNVASEILSLEPSQVIEFYLIYYNWPDDPSSILAITPSANGIGQKVIWQSQEYFSLPIEASNFKSSSDGELARPKIKIANTNSIISKYLKVADNLIGAKVVRKRTFVKFLDDENFLGENPYFDINTGNSMANPDSHLPEQVFYVNRRVSEDKDFVEFELSSVLELENVFLPNRNTYSRYCTWIYRGHGCRYAGDPLRASNDGLFKDSSGNNVTPTLNKGLWTRAATYNKGDFVFTEVTNVPLRKDGETDLNAPAERLKTFYVCVQDGASGNKDFPPISKKWQKDECSKKISACKLRFGTNLRFGGFPGTNAYPPRG